MRIQPTLLKANADSHCLKDSSTPIGFRSASHRFWTTRFGIRPYSPIFLLFPLLAACLGSCRHRASTHSVSFYYWRTHFHLSRQERSTLLDNGVKTLYTRYFDVDCPPGDTAPGPVAPLVFDESPQDTGSISDSLRIIPVIFIRNRVFEKLDTCGVQRLVRHIASQASAISATMNIRTSSMQFDCDWTEGTRDRYFLFLRAWRMLSHQPVSATIRLHQVKDPGKTGIPPVDRGVLMYYNMGDIGGGNQQSIYDKPKADKYIPSLKTYPLDIDLALPIFTWGLQVREGRVIQPLDKMNFGYFENDSNFRPLRTDRYRVKVACFKGGHYFRENDEVKIERVQSKDLRDIISQVNRYSNGRIGSLIFFDLDEANLIQYDKNIFKEILDRAD